MTVKFNKLAMSAGP